MRFLRTLSTTRLLALIGGLVAALGATAALAIAATGSTGSTPPAEPLASAIHDALSASAPDGISADIKFTNSLFPSGALTGVTGSALMSGATGRLWATNDGRGRLELQSSAGDAQIVWNPTQLTVYDASSNTVYKANLPTSADATSAPAGDTPPSLTEITSFLTDMSQNATVSDAQPDNVAGQPAYTVSISPKHDGGLLGSAQLAWDAATGVPLRIAIYAQGSSTPALALEATNISYGAVASSDVDVAPPAGATVVDLSGLIGGDPNSTTTSEPTGLPAVQSAVGFTVTAPDTLVGLPLQEVTAAGSDTAIAVYGQGLGAIVVSESKSADSSNSGGILSNLPTVSLDGTTAHELATQLGTAVEWDNQGITYVLAGSLPSAAAEAAARELPH